MISDHNLAQIKLLVPSLKNYPRLLLKLTKITGPGANLRIYGNCDLHAMFFHAPNVILYNINMYLKIGSNCTPLKGFFISEI